MATLGGVVAVGADRKLPPASEFGSHYREFGVGRVGGDGSGQEAHRWLGLACQMHYRPRELRRITRLLTIPPFEERPQLGTAGLVVSHDPVRQTGRLGGGGLATESAR